MYLSDDEKKMLQGELGDPVQKSMALLVALGEAFGAERMVPVKSVHITGGAAFVRQAEYAYVQDLAKSGGKFLVNSTTNPAPFSYALWKKMGVDEETIKMQIDYRNFYKRMGVIQSHTCTPYHIGNVPRPNEHIAWSESSAVIYANSVLGARTNREGAPSTIAAALTGRVPYFNYHLDQYRYGNIKIIVSAKLSDVSDYAAMGFFVGKFGWALTPVFIGIPGDVTNDQFKALGTTLSGAGGVALFHAVGITPEAKTEEQAFGPNKITQSNIVEFVQKELNQTIEDMQAGNAAGVDMVIFGCPHASIYEIKEIAEIIGERKLNPATQLWIYTSDIVDAYAAATGYKDVIEKSGGKLVTGTCPHATLHLLKNVKNVATNSGRGRRTRFGTGHFGSTQRCIEAAITGVWR